MAIGSPLPGPVPDSWQTPFVRLARRPLEVAARELRHVYGDDAVELGRLLENPNSDFVSRLYSVADQWLHFTIRLPRDVGAAAERLRELYRDDAVYLGQFLQHPPAS